MLSWPPRDEMGIVLHPFSWLTFLRSMPWLLNGFIDVPGGFWNLDVDDDDETVVIIACPCGAEPQVRPAFGVECVCERFYLATTTQVKVARPEGVQAAIPQTAAT